MHGRSSRSHLARSLSSLQIFMREVMMLYLALTDESGWNVTIW